MKIKKQLTQQQIYEICFKDMKPRVPLQLVAQQNPIIKNNLL
tara:strand:- start:211 stop:336 length:126 start_codon:yes stop_codon:yes gene_type:complete